MYHFFQKISKIFLDFLGYQNLKKHNFMWYAEMLKSNFLTNIGTDQNKNGVA